MTQEDTLNNIKKILSSASLVYSNEDFTSATILYFKAIFGVLDFIILKEKGKTPKDHTERFRIIEDSFPRLYEFLDKYFKIYRDTYSMSIDKETCDKIKENVNKIVKEYKIPL